MTFRQPIGLEQAAAGDRPGADEFRRMLTDLQGGVDSFVAGVMGPTHLDVTQRAAGANMSVDVAAGSIWVETSHVSDALGGHYWAHNDAVINVPIAAADPTNPRRDLVYVQLNDAFLDGGGVNNAEVKVLAGTPAGSPSDPSTAALDNFYVIARVRVAAADSGITDAEIDDKREYATPFRAPRGAIGTSTVDTSESTTGTTPGNLTTAGPEVAWTATKDRRIRAVVGAELWNNTVGSAALAGFVVAGATTLAAGTPRHLRQSSSTAGASIAASRSIVFTTTGDGATTATMKYWVGANTGFFASRSLDLDDVGGLDKPTGSEGQ